VARIWGAVHNMPGASRGISPSPGLGDGIDFKLPGVTQSKADGGILELEGTQLAFVAVAQLLPDHDEARVVMAHYLKTKTSKKFELFWTDEARDPIGSARLSAAIERLVSTASEGLTRAVQAFLDAAEAPST
jgi:hypothetical protein